MTKSTMTRRDEEDKQEEPVVKGRKGDRKKGESMQEDRANTRKITEYALGFGRKLRFHSIIEGAAASRDTLVDDRE